MFRFQLILFQGVKPLWPFNKRENHPPPLGEHEATNHNALGNTLRDTSLRASPKLASCSNSPCNLQVWGKKWIFVDDQKMVGPWVKIGHLFHDNCQFWNANFWLEAVSVFFFQREFPEGSEELKPPMSLRVRLLKVEIELRWIFHRFHVNVKSWNGRSSGRLQAPYDGGYVKRFVPRRHEPARQIVYIYSIYIYYRQVQKALNKKSRQENFLRVHIS